jgi:phage terminase large subunit
MKNDPKYVKRLENLSPAKRKAFLEGDWDAYDGQAFEEFRVDTHVCKPFPIPEHWFRWMGHDPGYTDPFSWHWFAVGEDGTVYVYREYTREYDDPKITYSDQAKRVVQLSERATLVHGQEVMQPENISYCATGVDAWNTHPLAEVGKTINDFYVEGGLRNCTRAITDRKLRKAVWHEYLSPYFHPIVGRNIAKIQIFSNCKRLIETIPQQLEDENDVEKVMQTDYDHQFDSAGYGLVSYHMNKSHTITTPLTGDAKRIDDHIESLIRKREKTHFKRYSVG